MKGSFSEDALEQFARLAAEKQGLDFAEGEVYDFARCVRSDGSFYGTGGKCRTGTEAGDKEEGEKKPKSEIPVLTKDDMAKMSVSDLKAVKKSMDERAFGKDSAPLSNTQLQGMSDQNKRINEELARRVTATPGMAAKVKAAKEKLKAEKAANGGKRTDRVQEEKRLERNRQQREMDRKLKAQQERQREMLRQSGDSGKKV